MKIAISGRVVTMDRDRRIIDRGVVYINDRSITAVQQLDAPAPPGFESVPVLNSRGTMFPGLIDLHNHISYNLLPLWRVDRRYTNRDQWAGTPHYRANVTGPIRVIGRSPDLLAPLARYVECKSLLAGVTATQGVAMFSNAGVRRFYQGVVRNVEQALDPELPNAAGRIADVQVTDGAKFMARLKKSSCMLLHLCEGTDKAAHSHFQALRTSSGWAITPALAGIHCVALTARDFSLMGERGASMVWSPTSNLILYGQTANVLAARKAGVRIGLGADWSTSGTRNLLGELRVSRAVAKGRIPNRDIVAMATCDAAAILGWSKVIGSIEPGKRADIIVVRGSLGDPYDALITADEAHIRLVLIDGAPRAGSESLMMALGAEGERVHFGNCTRVLALRDASSDPAVPFVELRAARDRVRTALKKLPEMAREGKRIARPKPGEPPTWYVDFDDPGCCDDRAPDPLVLARLDLDPLTIAGDDNYWASICAQPNLPIETKNELEALS